MKTECLSSQRISGPKNVMFYAIRHSFAFFTHSMAMSSLRSMCLTPALVVCGPSGGGKSTLLNKLMAEFADCFRFTVSHTTRTPRTGETDGKEYHFVDTNVFEDMIRNQLFVEFTRFSHHYYGTSWSSLTAVSLSGRIPVLDVELGGVTSLKEAGLRAKYVFIKPPDFAALERNLRSRGSEDEESLQRRLARALKDLKEVETSMDLFDLIVVNESLEEAYNRLKTFVFKDIEDVRRRRPLGTD